MHERTGVGGLRALVGIGSVALLARVEQVPGGWTPIGNVTVDKDGCAACPAAFPTPSRDRAFGLGTDTPYPVSLSGHVEIACANGTSYQVVVRPSQRGGLFQVIANNCPNLDSKEMRLFLTSVSLSPPDADRTVTLTAYGRLR